MSKFTNSVVSCAVAVVGIAGQSAGQLIYTSQERVASATSLGTPQTLQATDFGPFNVTAMSSGQVSCGSSSATASHNSVLGSSSITFTGDTGEGGGGCTGTASAHGSVSFRADFTLLQPCAFTLSGTLSVYPGYCECNDRIYVSLTGPTGVVAAQSIPANRVSQTVVSFTGTGAITGMLQPGDYELTSAGAATGVRGSRPPTSTGCSACRTSATPTAMVPHRHRFSMSTISSAFSRTLRTDCPTQTATGPHRSPC